MITSYLKKISVKYYITFFSSIIFGFLSQGMGLFNKFSFHDDVGNFGVGATVTSGRWMLEYLEILERIVFGDGHYSMPLFNGFLAIFFIGIAACLIVDLLDINNYESCVFIGGIMVCFPVITSIFGYMFTSHFYMFALLMSILGAYIICKHPKKQFAIFYYIIGIVLIGCSIGVYQAFIPITLSIILLYCIHLTASDTITFQECIKRMLLYIISVVFALVFYFCMVYYSLKQHNTSLTTYQGINTMGQATIYQYCTRIYHAYREFVFPTSYMYPYNIKSLYIIVISISFVLSIILFNRVYKKSCLKGSMILLLLLLIPLFTNFIFVMSEEIHSLMVYGQLTPFLFFIWLLEHTNISISFKGIKNAISVVICSLLLLINCMYCRFDNKCYLKATFTQSEAISFFTTLITQIKSVEGFNEELEVSYINEKKIEDKTLKSIYELEDIAIAPYWNVEAYVNDYVWKRFMKTWCGFSPQETDPANFEDLQEVIEMPSYPDDGSIKVVNGVVVVKF